MRPETRYAKSGDVNIAYQVVGDGPVDLILGHGWVFALIRAGTTVAGSGFDFEDRPFMS